MVIASAAEGPRRTIALAMLMTLAISACAATSSTSPPSSSSSPTPTASVTPTAPPSASASPSLAESAASDPAAGLAIGSPYTLTRFDPATDATLRQQFLGSVAQTHSIVEGARAVDKNGTADGAVIVFGTPPGTLTDAFYQQWLAGAPTTVGVTPTPTTISGVEVSVGSTAKAGYTFFRVGDRLCMAIGPDTTESTAIAESLIAAN